MAGAAAAPPPGPPPRGTAGAACAALLGAAVLSVRVRLLALTLLLRLVFSIGGYAVFLGLCLLAWSVLHFAGVLRLGLILIHRVATPIGFRRSILIGTVVFHGLRLPDKHIRASALDAGIPEEELPHRLALLGMVPDNPLSGGARGDALSLGYLSWWSLLLQRIWDHPFCVENALEFRKYRRLGTAGYDAYAFYRWWDELAGPVGITAQAIVCAFAAKRAFGVDALSFHFGSLMFWSFTALVGNLLEDTALLYEHFYPGQGDALYQIACIGTPYVLTGAFEVPACTVIWWLVLCLWDARALRWLRAILVHSATCWPL